jgi:hypothetical protein
MKGRFVGGSQNMKISPKSRKGFARNLLVSWKQGSKMTQQPTLSTERPRNNRWESDSWSKFGRR